MRFTLKKGTNISGWLVHSRLRGTERKNFIKKADIEYLKSIGVDHIRFPFEEEYLWFPDGSRDKEGWDLLKLGIEWCIELGLRVIANLHIFRYHHFNIPDRRTLFTDNNHAKYFVDLWKQLSDFMKDYPCDMLAYELLNEPVAENSDDWNRVYRYAYDAIREREDRRIIVIGSNKWNICKTFNELKIVENDPNIILTFHYYEPMFITHYTAKWVELCAAYTGSINYPGKPIADSEYVKLPLDIRKKIDEFRWNREFTVNTMIEDFTIPLSVAKRYGLTLWCGEFGVIDYCPDNIKVLWFRDIKSAFERLNIPWAQWCYKGLFGLIDNKGEPRNYIDVLFDRRKDEG